MDEVKKKLKEHDGRFDQTDKRLDLLNRTLAGHTDLLDLLATTVVSHTERLDRIEENMATKADISKVMNTLDAIVVLAKKKDEELTVLAHGQKITNDRLDLVEKDIKYMKPALGSS